MTRELWDRLDDETPAPWASFQVFLHLPERPRTLRAQSELPEGYAYGTLMQWSADFMWFDRAAAWDEHLEQARRRGIAKVTEREGEKMAKDRIRLLGKLRTVAEAKLDAVINGGNVDVHGISAQALIRMVREFNLLTRLEEGEATERVQHTDLSKHTDEQLTELEALLSNPRG